MIWRVETILTLVSWVHAWCALIVLYELARAQAICMINEQGCVWCVCVSVRGVL